MIKKIKINKKNTKARKINNKLKKKIRIVLMVSIPIFLIVIVLIIYVFMQDKEYESSIPKIKQEYYCVDGYTLIENKCYKLEIIDPNVDYYCVQGILNGNQCLIEFTYPSYTKKICPLDYMLVGVNCKKIGTYDNYGKCGSYYLTYDSITDMCYPKIAPYVINECYSGELVGNQCVDKLYIPANYNYVCPQGYTFNNNLCERILKSEPHIK